MRYFTLSIDFRNERYINQVSADSAENAAITWANSVDTTKIKYFGANVKQRLLKEIQEEVDEQLIISIRNSQKFWTFSYIVQTGFGIVDIIQTDENAEISDTDLFTFVMDFRGGTYFDQLTAGSIKQAVSKWAYNLNVNEIEHFGKKSKQQILETLADQNTTEIISPLEIAKNVWHFSFRFKTGFAVVHIIKTDTTT